MNERITPITIFLWAVVAGAGGMVRYVATSLETTTTLNLTGRMVFIYVVRLTGTGLVSGFTGLLFAILVSRFTGDINLQFVAAGVTGYSGPKTLDMLYKYLIGKYLPKV